MSEALTNAAKHAHASSIDVHVDLTVEDRTAREVLVLTVRDDGVAAG